MVERKLRMPHFLTGLSARLLVLTIFFVMLAEFLIYAPSIGRFRLVFLEDRITAAHLATLALEATPDNMISEALERKLLDHVGAHGVVLQRPKSKVLMLSGKMPPKIDAVFDLREETFFGLIADAFVTLSQNKNRVLRVRGPPPKDSGVIIEVVLDETPMRLQMYDYSKRIMALSIFISVITAALVYLSLQALMVWPMRRITASMVAFSEEPENPARVIGDSTRSDEVGIAQRELAAMQTGLRNALNQKARLATLGEAVTKINHDLRNILSTARLVSDRMVLSDDPQVKRSTPVLVKAIDRAVKLCTDSLNFTTVEPAVDARLFGLRDLVADVNASAVPAAEGASALVNNVDETLYAYADRDQLFRVLVNLVRNAVEAGADKVVVTAGNASVGGKDVTFIEIIDNGPGLPAVASENLFQPFVGSGHPGGTGLGLAIAREIMEAHGGTIELLATGAAGTTFRLALPAPPMAQGAHPAGPAAAA